MPLPVRDYSVDHIDDLQKQLAEANEQLRIKDERIDLQEVRFQELANTLKGLEAKASDLLHEQDASWEDKYNQAFAELEALRNQRARPCQQCEKYFEHIEELNQRIRELSAKRDSPARSPPASNYREPNVRIYYACGVFATFDFAQFTH